MTRDVTLEVLSLLCEADNAAVLKWLVEYLENHPAQLSIEVIQKELLSNTEIDRYFSGLSAGYVNGVLVVLIRLLRAIRAA